jgi:hypothetical protein
MQTRNTKLSKIQNYFVFWATNLTCHTSNNFVHEMSGQVKASFSANTSGVKNLSDLVLINQTCTSALSAVTPLKYRTEVM